MTELSRPLYKSAHSAAVISRPMIVSISRSIIRNWGTEYSLLEGMAKRFWPKTMKWCRAPEKGPSKLRRRSRRMNSARLHGVHRLAERLLVQVNAANNGQGMPQS